MAKKGYIWYNAHNKQWTVGYLAGLTEEEAMYTTAHEVDTWTEAFRLMMSDQVAAV